MKTRGWNERLIDFVDHLRGDAFEYGSTDCVALTLACMSIMTEEDEHRELAKQWTSEASAVKALKVIQPDNYLKAIGAKTVHLSACVSGDILTGMSEHLPTCHVVVGTNIFTSTPDDGVYLTPLDYKVLAEKNLKAWRLD